jgi:hypothetical protein
MFNKTMMTFIAIGLLCVSVQATPVARDEELVILSTEQTVNGTLTIWGVSDGTTSKARSESPFADLQKRQCGSNDVTCSGSHTADINSCFSLITNLENNPGTTLNESPRSICLTQNGNQCCVSWANPVGGLTQGQLVSAATKIFDTCINDRISGLARNVNLNGVCTTECLSDRATGCS